VERARARAPHTSKIEVEIQKLGELEEALAARADIILLDNFSLADIHAAVERASREPLRPMLEASGSITLDRIGELAAAARDLISVGALTHSIKAADIALDLSL